MAVIDKDVVPHKLIVTLSDADVLGVAPFVVGKPVDVMLVLAHSDATEEGELMLGVPTDEPETQSVGDSLSVPLTDTDTDGEMEELRELQEELEGEGVVEELWEVLREANELLEELGVAEGERDALVERVLSPEAELHSEGSELAESDAEMDADGVTDALLEGLCVADSLPEKLCDAVIDGDGEELSVPLNVPVREDVGELDERHDGDDLVDNDIEDETRADSDLELLRVTESVRVGDVDMDVENDTVTV